MSLNQVIYHRTKLAQALVSDLAGEGLLDYRSGLFLAAPRRTGKSTFLRNDLMPACEAQGWLAVYVDLWSNKQLNPQDLIRAAVAQALQPFDSRVRQLAKKVGIGKVTLLDSLSWDLSQPNLPDDATLSQALGLLNHLSKKLIVLIVDEAQHALETPEGLNTMFALKAARDALTQGGQDAIRLVFTGSSRDKLGSLVLKNKSPFYGASITPFPLLGIDFVEFVTKRWNGRLAESNQLSLEDVAYAFELVGHRPEMLAKLIAQVSLELGEAEQLGRLLRTRAITHQQGVWEEYESLFNSLTLLQKAVLLNLVQQAYNNEPFNPFSELSLASIEQNLLSFDAKASVSVSAASVQKALDALRSKDVIWRANRGEYALEDQGMSEWLLNVRFSGVWEPG